MYLLLRHLCLTRLTIIFTYTEIFHWYLHKYFKCFGFASFCEFEMTRKCSVPLYHGSYNKKCSVYRFPKHNEIKKAWIKNIARVIGNLLKILSFMLSILVKRWKSELFFNSLTSNTRPSRKSKTLKFPKLKPNSVITNYFF